MTAGFLWELFAVLIYFGILIFVAVSSYKKHLSNTDFIIGNRSLNFWTTALAAHASDMSSWLFMGYPAMIYLIGVHQSWSGIGLWVFFFLNWQLIAPKIRTATEEYNSLTFSSFFENRLADISGVIRVFTAIMLFVFYTIYISAALVGMGYVLNTLFGIEYHPMTLHWIQDKYHPQGRWRVARFDGQLCQYFRFSFEEALKSLFTDDV